MLITIYLQDKPGYLFRLFNDMWPNHVVECAICYDRVRDDGIVAITDGGAVNLEKMFHRECLQRWLRENIKDPFNRHVKYWFNFPPKTTDECASMLAQVKKFIGDDVVDKIYAAEHARVLAENAIDLEFDLEDMLKYN